MMGEPHEWTGEQWRCTTCHCTMHCPHCERGCEGQGHLMRDDDGYFFGCVAMERRQRWLDSRFKGAS